MNVGTVRANPSSPNALPDADRVRAAEYLDLATSAAPQSSTRLRRVASVPATLAGLAAPATKLSEAAGVWGRAALGLAEHLTAHGNAAGAAATLRLAAQQPHFASWSKMHSACGTAQLDAIQEMNERGELGSLRVSVEPTDKPEYPSIRVEAERLDYLKNAARSNGQFLSILQSPDGARDFVQKNGADVYAQCYQRVATGLVHALLEIRIFAGRIAAVNNNAASAGFISRMLLKGRLTEDDPVVKSFRNVQKDPFYAAIAKSGRCVAQVTPDHPQMAWDSYVAEQQLDIRERFVGYAPLLRAAGIGPLEDTLAYVIGTRASKPDTGGESQAT